MSVSEAYVDCGPVPEMRWWSQRCEVCGHGLMVHRVLPATVEPAVVEGEPVLPAEEEPSSPMSVCDICETISDVKRNLRDRIRDVLQDAKQDVGARLTTFNEDVTSRFVALTKDIGSRFDSAEVATRTLVNNRITARVKPEALISGTVSAAVPPVKKPSGRRAAPRGK